jgi:arsenical pump membrane protein
MLLPDAAPARWVVGAVAAASIAGVVARPWRLPEWCWPVAAALLLVGLQLLPAREAWQAAAAGWDVYLFIGAMMLVAELARREGLFDWLAALALERARGSPARLFALVYVVAGVVTVFMSNDATAVVLTPAVAAAARRARVNPLPHLFACAFVANAASFALPISNPANLVVFDGALPGLARWIAVFAPAAIAATIATWLMLRWSFRRELAGAVADSHRPVLQRTGRAAAVVVIVAAVALMGASALHWPLGPPAALAAMLGLAGVCAVKRETPVAALRGVSWGSLALVAGLFVIVKGLEAVGAVQALARLAAAGQGRGFDALAGLVTALASNAMNNLPAGMLAAATLSAAHASGPLRSAVAVGIDLGPNLTIIGSLSTVLWLIACRREQVDISAWHFARVGALAMPVALACAFALLR